jgi:hypothetical protein
LTVLNDLQTLESHKTKTLISQLDQFDIGGRYGSTALMIDDAHDDSEENPSTIAGVDVNLKVASQNACTEEWLANPVLMEADPDAEYFETIESGLNELKEPALAIPNDPDASALLSEVAGTHIDEVFIGSCMTNIGHFRRNPFRPVFGWPLQPKWMKLN